MEETQVQSSRPANPRRRKPTPMQIFKERFLPLIILALTAILLVTFVVGSIVRAVQRNQYDKEIALEASSAAHEEHERLAADGHIYQFHALFLGVIVERLPKPPIKFR